MEDLKNMNARELRNFAKTNKIRGYAKYSKRADLLNFILNQKPENKLSRRTIPELKHFAKTNKIQGYSKYTKKTDLLNFLSNQSKNQ